MPVYHIDFHHHCGSDPVDRLPYSDFELIDAAIKIGLNAIAITPHGEVYHHPEAVTYAREKGLLLIPGIEKMIEGREIVLLNVLPAEIPKDFSFEDLRKLRATRGNSLYVFAPHPFYPRASCAGPVLNRIKDLIDAVEYAHLYFSFYNRPNKKALRWADLHQKTVLCNSDSHSLNVVGRNHSVIEASLLTPEALFSALKANKPRLVTRPYSLPEFFSFALQVLFPLECHHLRKKIFR